MKPPPYRIGGARGMIIRSAAEERKCSFRFLLIEDNGWAAVITQDSRRGRNFVTGCHYVPISERRSVDVARQGANTVLKVRKMA